jgi:peptide chain release factor 2
LTDEIEELEQKAAESEFWNDMENSQKVLQKTKALKNKLEIFNNLVSEWEDLITLSELGIEEQDDSIISEVSE